MCPDLLRIRLWRDRESVPVTTHGLTEPTLSGRVPHRLRELSLSVDGLAHLLDRPSLLGLGEVNSGKDDVSRDHRRFVQAALQVTDVAPLALDRVPVVVDHALLLLDPIRQAVQVAVVHHHGDEGEPQIPVAQVE